ncbi:MAG: penicillin-binding protein 2 [Alphaproteobacteria bacterium]|nr:penicillin-binding protein 2 [Alphaproteobacteria bacterium]
MNKSRLALIYILILAAFLLIIIRMFFVVLLGDKVKVSNIYDVHKAEKRANIFDRNDTLLSTDLKTKSLYISSVLIKDPGLVAQGIAGVFPDLSQHEILKKISEHKLSKQWILIRRNLTPLQVDAVQDLKMAGLIFEDDRIRVYPQKSIVSHYVGYVDRDRKGLAGMEMQYNHELARGEDLQLAMDVRVQDILHDELLSAMQEYHAKAASGLVVNVNNGEVIALSSLPDFDANSSNKASADEYFNRVTNGVYELGSVMKLFTNTIAFEENLVKASDVFNVSEPIKYGRFTITDYHPIKNDMSVEEIFAYSSNIGTIKIANKIGAEKQKEFLAKIGLLKKLRAEFPGLGKPIYPRNWSEISLYTISYGHGIAITPLHFAMAASAVVNGGVLHKPSFVKLDKQPHGERVIKASTSEKMREMLRRVVEYGTGKNANVEGYNVGGKTGTAERAESGSYSTKLTTASFVATFPINKPQYLIYIVFDRPNYIFNTGGVVAAPVAGKVIKNIAPLLGVQPESLSKISTNLAI